MNPIATSVMRLDLGWRRGERRRAGAPPLRMIRQDANSKCESPRLSDERGERTPKRALPTHFWLKCDLR